jgi:hypothetical protein
MATYRNRPAYVRGEHGLATRVAIARVITAAASVVAAIIVAAIVLHLLNANPSNDIVDAIHQAGSWLTTPFHNLFSPNDGDLRMTLNWGIAAAVYLVVARILARVIVR